MIGVTVRLVRYGHVCVLLDQIHSAGDGDRWVISRTRFRSAAARAEEQAESAAAKERMGAEQEQLRRDVTSNLAAAFEEKVGNLVLDLESAATQLEASAHTMSDTAEHANKQAAIVAHNAGQATTNVEAVSGATKELVASGQDMFALVRNSMKLIGQAVQGTRQADNTVIRLVDGAKKIGDIVKLIGEIASQTNLFALNATIEAVPAIPARGLRLWPMR
jgi:methyl-accepting chemotaxis protein